MSPLPELQGKRYGIDLVCMTPSSLVARSVELAMADTTERNRKLIADFAAKGARLGKANMVRIASSLSDLTGCLGMYHRAFDSPASRGVAR